MADAYRRLAERDGARFYRASESDRWTAEDSDGVAIVSDAMSIAEAARLYCEDKGLPTSHEVLARIVDKYRPFHVLKEFWDGFVAYQQNPVLLCNPYKDRRGMQARAWDGGTDVAMQYEQALARIATSPDKAGRGWVVTCRRRPC